MIKAIFFDIDGTLVSFKTHIMSEETKQSLRKLQDKGIKIFIATGRGKDGLEVLKDINFDGYITLNGQYCFYGDEVIFENFIKKNDLHTLIEEIKKHPFPCGFTTNRHKVFNYRDERVDIIHSITHNDDHPAGDISHIEDQKVYQCMAFIDESEEKELLSKLTNCTSARWHPLFTDISPIGGTKVKGIEKFLEYYSIDREETMAFGDGGNDKQMLEYVHTAVVMDNGVDSIKEIADYITDDVDHEGITKALRHYKLI